MQADAEHQQDDADLGELARERLVGDEARREGADGDAGEQIADQRRQAVRRCASQPNNQASASATTIVEMSGVG